MRAGSVITLLTLAACTACSEGVGSDSRAVQAKANGPLAPMMDYTGAPGCTRVRISESAVYDAATNNFNTGGQMAMGDQAPINFTSVVLTLDMNFDRLLAGKNFKATQREVLTFDNGDQLYIEGVVMSVPMSTPYLWDASGSFKFVGGTGAFRGAHGNAFLKGLTMIAPNAASSINWDVAELCL